MFGMYSTYLSDLEGRVREISKDHVAYRIFSHREGYWFQSKHAGRRMVTALVALFSMFGYTIIVSRISSGFEWRSILFTAYMGAMLITIVAIYRFMRSNAEYRGIL